CRAVRRWRTVQALSWRIPRKAGRGRPALAGRSGSVGGDWSAVEQLHGLIDEGRALFDALGIFVVFGLVLEAFDLIIQFVTDVAGLAGLLQLVKLEFAK